MLDTISAHLQSLDPFDRTFARYLPCSISTTQASHLRRCEIIVSALSKLVNSLSWGFVVTNPTPIDPLETIFYIDLRHYEWDRTSAWKQIEALYPYNAAYQPKTQGTLLEKMSILRIETDSIVPFVHVDWFLATASLPPLYNDILGLSADNT